MIVQITGANLGFNRDKGGVVFIKVDDSVFERPIKEDAQTVTF